MNGSAEVQKLSDFACHVEAHEVQAPKVEAPDFSRGSSAFRCCENTPATMKGFSLGARRVS
jgi:hypothetical protein